MSRKSPQLIGTTHLSCRKWALSTVSTFGGSCTSGSWYILVPLSDLKISEDLNSLNTFTLVQKDSNELKLSWSIAEAGTVAGQPPKLSTNTFPEARTRAQEVIELSDQTLADLVSAYLSFLWSCSSDLSLFVTSAISSYFIPDYTANVVSVNACCCCTWFTEIIRSIMMTSWCVCRCNDPSLAPCQWGVLRAEALSS